MRAIGVGIGVGLACLGGIATAQTTPQVDCLAPSLSVEEVRFCAAQAYDEADAELSQTFRLALTRAQAFDEETAAQGKDVPILVDDALRRSQDAWLAYREAACDAETALLRDGTGVPEAGTICRARLSVARTQELREFAPDT